MTLSHLPFGPGGRAEGEYRSEEEPAGRGGLEHELPARLPGECETEKMRQSVGVAVVGAETSGANGKRGARARVRDPWRPWCRQAVPFLSPATPRAPAPSLPSRHIGARLFAGHLGVVLINSGAARRLWPHPGAGLGPRARRAPHARTASHCCCRHHRLLSRSLRSVTATRFRPHCALLLATQSPQDPSRLSASRELQI